MMLFNEIINPEGILQVVTYAYVNVGGGRGPRVDREGRRLPPRGE